MKKVLFISYHYPPRKTVGSIRASKFVHYLQEYGWEPIVLTAATGLEPEGHSRNVYPVREWPHPLKAFYRFKHQRAAKKGLTEEFSSKMSISYAVSQSPPSRGIQILKSWLMDLLSFPDKELGWLLPAIWRGFWLIHRYNIRYVFSSAPPNTTQLIALALKRLTGVRWIADFRDPWNLDERDTIMRHRVTDAVLTYLINQVMKRSDVVISVTEPMTERLRKDNCSLKPEKFVTITNGFDAADFAGLPHSPLASHPLIFTYLGTFYYGRTPEPFLRALRSLFNDNSLQTGDLIVKLIGHVSDAEGQSVKSIVRRLGLDDVVQLTPPVPRREALILTLQSHVLLVLTELVPYAMPYKLFEGLASGKIILNIGCGGAVAEVLDKTGRGIAVNHTSQAEIRDGILECVRRVRSERSLQNSEPWSDPQIKQFQFKKLTERLAELLDPS